MNQGNGNREKTGLQKVNNGNERRLNKPAFLWRGFL